MVTGLPSNYIFMILPCYEVDCPHPVCAKGKLVEEPMWYPGGPPLSLLPLPIPDPERLLGSNVCTKCPGFCNSHYLEHEEHIKWVTENGSDSCQRVPPRVVIEEYVKSKESMGQDDIENLAKICFLSLEDAEGCAKHHMGICQIRKVQQKRQRTTTRNQDDKNCQVDGQEESVYCICRRGEKAS